MRSGQAWSVDFAVSLLLFVAAMVIAYTMLTNVLSDRKFDDVRTQARGAAELLVTPGYPDHWTNESVIRTGLVADSELSLRKARALASVDNDAMRKGLRVTDAVYVYVLNATNGTEAVFGECGVGDLSVSSVPAEKTLNALAIGDGKVGVSVETNATVFMNDSFFDEMERADVLVLEGNVAGVIDRSLEQSSIDLADVAMRGITAIVIGDPGFPVWGIETNSTTASTIQVTSGAGKRLGLTEGETIDIEIGGSPVAIPTLITPGGSAVGNFETIATAMGKPAIATWTFNDARIWYVATHQGTLSGGGNLTETLINATEDVITIPWPSCSPPTFPANAEQIVHYDRIVSYHDRLLTLRIVMWGVG